MARARRGPYQNGGRSLVKAMRDLSEKRGGRSFKALRFSACHRLLEAYYGVLEAGCILLPLNVRLGPEELAFVLDDAQARFLFIEPVFRPLVESFRAFVPSIESYFLLDGEPQANWLKPCNYD